MMSDEGSKELMMGNEAVARGAIEAGAAIAIGYPGTPSSEVIATLISISDDIGMRAEWAVNEKVAFDIAAGISMAGTRCLVTMKSAGLNVASDSIMSVAYGDVDGGLVIYVADDPGAHAGMEEQDSRVFTGMVLLPMIDVSDPQDAKDAIVKAFDLSEEFKIPVFVRSTSSVAHMRAVVQLGQRREMVLKAELTRDIRKYTRASPVWCQEQHALLNERIEEMRTVVDGSELNTSHVPEGSRFGVVASGISWTYLKEVITRHSLIGIATFKVGTVNPLPENSLKAFVGGLERVLILEELEPFIEKEVKALMFDSGKEVIIMGKGTGSLRRVGDYNYDLVEEAVGELLGESLAGTGAPSQATVESARRLAPRRPLPFCPGCPHRGTYTAMSRAFKELGYKKDEVVVTGDIGCTILGMHPPFDMCWNEVSMGASIALAIGYKYAGYDKPVVATIGDSTFFHAGIPPAINAVWKDTDIVIAVLDNRITAMTGHQLSPSSDYTTAGEASGTISIEAILEAAGINNVDVVDPYDLDATKQAFVDALNAKGPTAVVLRRTCSLVARRLRMIAGPSRVDPDKCTSCLLCLRTVSCPAMSTGENGKVEIDPSTCNGCAICVQICPFDAITPGGES